MLPPAPVDVAPAVQAPPRHLRIREAGSSTGVKVRWPSSWDELLRLSSNLVLGGNTTAKVYDAAGDEIVDLNVVSSGEVLYVSASTDAWRPAPSPLGQRFAKNLRRNANATGSLRKRQRGPVAAGTEEALGALMELLPVALRTTPLRRSDETPARLCGGRPPYGLMGDPTQLGSDANFSRLRGVARQQAHLSLCMSTARRMQQRNLEAVGRLPSLFPRGASCAVVGSGGSLIRARHGAAIDAHDVVMRFNLAPAGGAWAADVGSRTTIRLLTDKVVAPFFRAPSSRGYGRSVEPGSAAS